MMGTASQYFALGEKMYVAYFRRLNQQKNSSFWNTMYRKKVRCGIVFWRFLETALRSEIKLLYDDIGCRRLYQEIIRKLAFN